MSNYIMKKKKQLILNLLIVSNKWRIPLYFFVVKEITVSKYVFFSFLFILKTQCKTDKNNSINKKEYLLFHNLKKKVLTSIIRKLVYTSYIKKILFGLNYLV